MKHLIIQTNAGTRKGKTCLFNNVYELKKSPISLVFNGLLLLQSNYPFKSYATGFAKKKSELQLRIQTSLIVVAELVTFFKQVHYVP
jgi:hypothetical protein